MPSSTTNGIINAAGTSITFYLDSVSNTNDRVISAGSNKPFTLRGVLSLTGTNSTGGINVALSADTAYPTIAGFMSTASTVDALGSKMVWSPSSLGTAATTDSDWTNGYGLAGCFTTAGLGNDCTVRTVSK